jgi:lipoate-protein ligase A
MKRLELTLGSPAENLALDEAILERAISTSGHPEVLRLWESDQAMVVLGRSSPIEDEVDLVYCQASGIPVLRRCSGGQAIVTGPGCLMYSVLLDFRQRPALRKLECAHRFVMEQIRAAIFDAGIETQINGTSDLTIGDRKFSGNSLRCKKDWMIYHGTLLLDFDLELISHCLGQPIRQPDYRLGRSHSEFLTNLGVESDKLRASIFRQWKADEPFSQWPAETTRRLSQEKYETTEWTYKIRKKRSGSG